MPQGFEDKVMANRRASGKQRLPLVHPAFPIIHFSPKYSFSFPKNAERDGLTGLFKKNLCFWTTIEEAGQ